MARLRTIKPGFFLNEELARLPAVGRLLFAGLWCVADRRGRLEDRPARIKAEILPYDDCDVDALLAELVDAGFVLRYSVDGKRCIQIVNFERHQQPHYKEADSTLPAPDGHEDSPIITFGVSEEQRQRILERDEEKCQQCGTTERLSIDHIIPRSRGGTGDDGNLQVLCVSCNASKNNRVAASSSFNEGRVDVDPSSAQGWVDESGASPSVFGLLSSVNGLRSSEITAADAAAPLGDKYAAEIDTVFAYYKARIQPAAKIKPDAKIRARLKRWGVDELLKAIDHFSQAEWWMEHCAHKGADWFFRNDAKIEEFLNLDAAKERTNGTHSRVGTSDPSEHNGLAKYAQGASLGAG